MRIDKSTFRSIVDMLDGRRPGLDEVEVVYFAAPAPADHHPPPHVVVGGGGGDFGGRRPRPDRKAPQQQQQQESVISRDAALRLLAFLSGGGGGSYAPATPDGGLSLDVSSASSPVRYTLRVPSAAPGLSRAAVPSPDEDEGTVALKKERVRPAVGIPEYRMRFNMKSEVAVPVQEALSSGTDAATLLGPCRGGHGGARTYRSKKRYSFVPVGDNAGDTCRIDITAVRQLTQSTAGQQPPTFAQVMRAPERYEVEVECVDVAPASASTSASLAQAMLRHFVVMLKVLDEVDDGAELLSVSERRAVLLEYGELVAEQKSQREPRFVGPKPVTLERHHLLCASSGTPCATRDYTVTDKADGERRLLFVAADRRAYTINDRLFVRDTGLRARRLASCLLDGEHLPEDDDAAARFLAFDAYHIAGRDVRALPLMLDPASTESVDGGGSTRRRGGEPKTRLDAARRVVDDLQSSAADVTDGGGGDAAAVTGSTVVVKEFRHVSDVRTLAEACRHVLLRRDSGRSRYHVDGLILTPATAPVPSGGGTWDKVLKWKPPEQNTIDFQVRLRPPGDLDLAVLRQGSSSSSSGAVCAVADLLVGQDPWLGTPLTAMEYLSGRAEERLRRVRPNMYEAVPFSPPPFEDAEEPPQKMLHVAYLKLTLQRPLCASGDEIVDGSVVEFAYDAAAKPDVPHAARWRPLRVRWDKVEKQQRTGSVSANSAATAYSVWASVMRPVTEAMLRDPAAIGALQQKQEDDKREGDGYYVAQLRGSDDADTGAMRRFHNYWVKRTSLLMRFPASRGLGRSIFDIGCGQGGDIPKWLEMGATRVVGVDKHASNLYDPNMRNKRGSAYVRLMQAKGGDAKGSSSAAKALRAVFLPMDASMPLSSQATIDAMDEANGDRAVARAVWGLCPLNAVQPPRLRDYYSFARNPFDLVTCMFALHYFFESPESLATFARNVAEAARPGGHFVACCLDGERVEALLDGVAVGGSVGASGWRITRRYAAQTPAAAAAPPNKKKGAAKLSPPPSLFGRRIDVLMDSIGTEVPEFLVDRATLVSALGAVGLRPVTPAEAAEIGLLPAADTGTFDELFGEMRRAYPVGGAGNVPPAVVAALSMSDDEKRYSFMNRWFVFKKAGPGGATGV